MTQYGYIEAIGMNIDAAREISRGVVFLERSAWHTCPLCEGQRKIRVLRPMGHGGQRTSVRHEICPWCVPYVNHANPPPQAPGFVQPAKVTLYAFHRMRIPQRYDA